MLSMQLQLSSESSLLLSWKKSSLTRYAFLLTLFTFFFLDTAAEQLYILVYVLQVKNNRSSEQYQFDHPNSARRALKNTALGKPFLAFPYHLLWLNLSVFIWLFLFLLSVAYLGSLEDAEITELALHEYQTATNLTEQFAALVSLDQKPGEVREEVLADFYNKWQHDYLVCWVLNRNMCKRLNTQEKRKNFII